VKFLTFEVFKIVKLSTDCKIFFHITNDDYELLKFKKTHQIPELSRSYSVLKDFPGPRKVQTFFKDYHGPVATLMYLGFLIGNSGFFLKASVVVTMVANRTLLTLMI